MPKIYIHGCDYTKQIEHMTVTVDVWMKPSLYKDPVKAMAKLKELSEKLEAIVAEYFPDYNEPDIEFRKTRNPY